MKKLGVVLTIIVVAASLYAYLKNDGMYVLSNINNTELDWINKYAIYDTEFPDETIVEEFIKEDDIESYFFSHNEYIHATLLVPNEAMDKIVPQLARDYDVETSLDLSYGMTGEQVQYNVWMPITVVKWIEKTQRSILYTVMQPGDKYTRVYIHVDKLGWNLYMIPDNYINRKRY
ncbi:MAG: hypothetical protein J6N52_10660 [Clostridia bacterium]|nr:hypothetical protein [Clostridia bacterium]